MLVKKESGTESSTSSSENKDKKSYCGSEQMLSNPTFEPANKIKRCVCFMNPGEPPPPPHQETPPSCAAVGRYHKQKNGTGLVPPPPQRVQKKKSTVSTKV